MKKLNILLIAFAFILTACEEEKEYIHVGPNWNTIYQLKDTGKSFKIELSGVKSSYHLGETLVFDIQSKKTGKLWIVQVDPNDEVSLLMPNQLQMDNRIEAKTPFHFPPAQVDWSAPAEKPLGKSVLAFIVTTGDADLNQVLSSKSSDTMQKTFHIIKAEPEWAIQTKVVDIKE